MTSRYTRNIMHILVSHKFTVLPLLVWRCLEDLIDNASRAKNLEFFIEILRQHLPKLREKYSVSYLELTFV